ncbi:MAG TPA: toll/interleukin-1 receptor domain-containing protein [Flavisolibacter sp.]|nr:toll/interleukin-1 receptor domain-containing protein [Flavisolibacter sp.]
MAYKVFISHGSDDTWVAQQIEKQILHLGATTFLDASVIEGGDKFEDEIFGEIPNSDELFVLLTPWSIERAYIQMEIGAGISDKKRIVFVLYGITKEEMLNTSKMPAAKTRQMFVMNELDKYFKELANRIFLNNK